MRPGTDWVVDKVADMLAHHEVLAVGARSAGPVASLLPELRGDCDDTGVDFVKVGSTDFGGQCGSFYDAAMSGGVRHLSDPRIDGALAAARRHQVLDAWTWEGPASTPMRRRWWPRLAPTRCSRSDATPTTTFCRPFTDFGALMLTTVLDALGAALIVAGVALVFWPAALVVAGAALIAASWRLER